MSFLLERTLVMRQFFLLLVVVATLSFLPGCSGSGPAAKSSPEEQKQRLADTEAAMKKGMEAMKGIKGPSEPGK